MGNPNDPIITEFRANAGNVGGPFAGAPLLLLSTTGIKSGKRHITPLTYLADADRLFVFATNAGKDNHPDWYYNLLVQPRASVEIGTEAFEVTATVVSDDKRDQIYARQARLFPPFADYERKTARCIPVVSLQR